MHALFQLSGAIRTLAKVPSRELADDMTVTQPPSVYNAKLDKSIDDKSPMYPAIRETFDDQSDTQLALAAPHLVRAAEICHNEIEVQTNIVRTLSVLSEQDKCCEMLVDLAPRIGILLGPSAMRAGFLEDNAGGQAQGKPYGVLSRIGYILGNVMAKYDAARGQVAIMR